MTTRTISLALALASALLASLSLTACGGGGSDSTSTSTTTFDSSSFQGTWKRNDGTAAGNAANCFNFNSFGGTYGGLNRSSVITGTTITDTVEVYSDNTCTRYLGLFVRTYSVVWSAGAVSGKTNVAKVLVTSTGHSMQRDGAAGYSLSSPPTSGVSSKTLLDVEGALMYIGSIGGTLDADGYPTSVQSTALYVR